MTMKEAYQEKLHHQMEEWKAEIKLLRAKLGNLHADARIKAEEELALLQEKQDLAAEKLEEIKKSGEEVWEQAKAGLEIAWEDFKNAMESIKKHFV